VFLRQTALAGPVQLAYSFMQRRALLLRPISLDKVKLPAKEENNQQAFDNLPARPLCLDVKCAVCGVLLV